MTETRNPIRLLVETLLIVALAQLAVMRALPTIAAGLPASSQTLLSAALLVLLAGPTLYWRCMAGTRPVAAAPRGRGAQGSSVQAAIAMTATAQALGLALTGAGVVWQQHEIAAAAKGRFDHAAEQIEAGVRRQFSLPLHGLNGLRGLLAADGRLTRARFRAWVESRDLAVEFPGVLGFGYIERVPRGELARFVAARRAEGDPEFAVDTAGDAPDLYLVKYIEPTTLNAVALGKDAGRESVRREAAERAVDSAAPALSGRIALARDGQRSPGLLYYVPVYRGGTAAAAGAPPEQRRSLLIGLLYTPIVASEIMKGVASGADGTLDIELFEGETAAAGGLLFDSRGDATPGRNAAGAGAPGPAYQSVRHFAVGGRTLALRATSTPAFDASIDHSSVTFVAVGGLLASFLMALAVWLLAVGRVRAQRRAQYMTADLARLARVAQHTSNSVAITDAQMRIQWVNEGFTRITGYTLAEAAGRTPGELLGSGKADPAAIRTLLDAWAAGQTCRVEVLNRAKDGHEYWIDTEVQPTRDADGVLTGFMEVSLDITAHKQTRLQLEAAIRESDAAKQQLTGMADRLTLAIEGGSDGLWDWMDVHEDAVWWSPSFYALLGLQPSELAAGRTAFESLLHARDLAPFQQATEEALAGRRAFDIEFLLRTGDGGWRWFRSRAKVHLDAAGRATRMAGSLQDIHDRKQAERELGRERQRLDRILEGTNVGTWEWHIESGKTHFNERWAQIIGRTLDELGATTVETWMAYEHPDDRSRAAVLLEQHFNGDLPHYECETRMQHKEGHWVWVLDRGKLFSRSSDGRPRWMAGTRMDITLRKRAEQALRDSEAFLDRVGRIAGVGGWIVDLQSGSIVWSAQTCRIHDMPPGHRPTMEEAISYYAPAARPVMEAAVREGISGGRPFDLELPFVTARGRSIWVRAVGEVEFEDGKPMRLVGTFQDITERRALDAELRRSNELMTSVLQNLPCGLSVFDDNLELIAQNNQFHQLLDLPEDLFGGRAVTFDRIVRLGAERGDYGAGAVDDIVTGVVDGARLPVVQFFERSRTNGLDLEVRRAPIPGGGFVTTYTDVSARKRAEMLLKEALTRAEQAGVTKSQFLANMSHEIRTPMNAILGMLSLLQKTGLTARQLDYASKTEGAARSLLGLLNDILDFSKAEAGKMMLDARPFRVDRMLRDLSVILSATLGAKTIDVLFDIDPSLPPCLLGDDMRLQQVLINLGGNAIKFTAEGEVVLSLRVLERSAQDVLLGFVMRDTGIGIAPENQAHIFTGFSQAEAATTRRYGGTGLGLAISQRLVALMGGELGLDSTPGRGSSFHFRIRLALADSPDDAPLAAPTPPGALRTLIVDDNASAREVFVAMARSLGWQADAAASGAEALALAAAQSVAGRPYEALFMDWKMPGLDGWETGRRILQTTAAAGQLAPLLVMVTGHGRETLAERSAEEQAILSGFLVKPVTAAMLLDAVCDARLAVAQPRSSRAPAAIALQRLAGMRLLLVEDNANNQQVARELLSDEGAQVEVAANGQLGVDAVAAADPPFDAVLMDVQMPVMDGYTATARIRQQLGMTALPIIAMTANAMASDREACLAAGMNEHVGKPFDLSKLVATLLRQTGRAAPAPAKAQPGANAVSAELLARAEGLGIDLAGALGRMAGNGGVYLRALRSFCTDLATLAEQLDSLVQQQRQDEAVRLMHTYKGMAGTLGIRTLASLAADIERGLGHAQAPARAWIEQLGSLVVATRRDITVVGDALQAALDAAAPRAVAYADPGPEAGSDLAGLQRSLDELSGLLRRADMRALEVFERLQQTHAAHAGVALRPLDEAITALDFDGALVQCGLLGRSLDR